MSSSRRTAGIGCVSVFWNETTTLIDVLFLLTAYVPPDTTIDFVPTSFVYDTLCDDLYVETSVVRINTVLKNHSIANQLLDDTRFTSTFFYKALELSQL